VKGKERRAVAPDWRAIYQAATTEGAEQEREILVARWDSKYPTISALWRRHWEQITPWFAFPPEIRRIIYTTNAVES
jgi:putative transposase